METESDRWKAISNNNGGGLGNWHDMILLRYLQSRIRKYATVLLFEPRQKPKQGGPTRLKIFGTDSFVPMTGIETNSGCTAHHICEWYRLRLWQ